MRRAAKSKFFYIFGGALILILGIYFFSNYSKTETTTVVKDESAKVEDQSASQSSAKQESQAAASDTIKPKTAAPSANSQFSDESNMGEGSDVEVAGVHYDGKTFVPSSVKIKPGDYVFFYNDSTKPFTLVSDPATAYPTFTSKTPIAVGDVFQFKFTKAGKWSYTDTANKTAKGAITVSQ